MKGIRWTAPKYVLPLIALPFLVGINFLVRDMFASDIKDQSVVEEVKGLNINLPQASSREKDINTKFETFQEHFKTLKDYSGVKNIGEEKERVVPDESRYTASEQQAIDSANYSPVREDPVSPVTAPEEVNKKQLAELKRIINETSTQNHQVGKPDRVRKAIPPSPTRQQVVKRETEEEKEMRLFREQLALLDSVTKTPEQRAAEQHKKLLEEQQRQQTLREQARKAAEVNVVKATRTNAAYFNTFSSRERDQFIKAIIDENIKVVEGSRIRIRIIDDIVVAGNVMEKGTYLYGIVSGFKQQRLHISVSSIVMGDEIKPVNLTLYDNDGMKGLYIPRSEFVEFSKQLASDVSSGGSTISIDDNTPNTLNEFFYGMANTGMRTSTRTASRAARKNKAFLKYNTIVYLVNPDEL